MKLKLRARFLIVSWSVLAIVAISGTVCWYLASQVNDHMALALGTRMKQVEIYQEITQLVDSNYIGVSSAITLKTPEEAKEAKKEFLQTTEQISMFYKELESLLTSEIEKSDYQKILETRKEYIKLRNSALDYYINLDSESARKDLLQADERRVLYVKAIDTAQRHVQDLMKKSKDDAHSQIQFLIYTDIGVSVFLSIVIFLSFWNIGRTLSKTLGEDPVLLSGKVRHLESGDFRWQNQTYPEGSIGDSVQTLVRTLQKSLLAMKEGSTQISAATAEIAMGNQDLSARTEKMAANLEEVSSSMQSVTQLVHSSANDARTASQLAEQANQKAIQGKEVMTEVSTGMNRITASSKKIADIVGVIDGIAFQTNILALNAAVEAARAGEQGRGFAVVAAEVRALSQRSSSAAKEIKDLITQSVQDIDTGAHAVQNAVESIEGINADIMETSARMRSIVVATQEQSDSFEQINAAIIQLDEVTQQNAALVEETASASDSVRSQAMEMAKETEHFQF